MPSYFMNTEQEMAVRGQMMTEYRENEATLVALREEARRFGEGLEGVGRALQGIFLEACYVDAAGLTVEALGGERARVVPRTVFDVDRLDRLTADVRRLVGRQRELRTRLEQIGFLPPTTH